MVFDRAISSPTQTTQPQPLTPDLWVKVSIDRRMITHAVFIVGMSRNPLLPVVVIRSAGASLLLTFDPPSLSETEALKTVAKKSHPFVTPPFWSSCCCFSCCCCCCSCCCEGTRFLRSLVKGLLLTVIFWLSGFAPGRLLVEEKLGGMTNSMSFLALDKIEQSLLV